MLKRATGNLRLHSSLCPLCFPSGSFSFFSPFPAKIQKLFQSFSHIPLFPFILYLAGPIPVSLYICLDLTTGALYAACGIQRKRSNAGCLAPVAFPCVEAGLALWGIWRKREGLLKSWLSCIITDYLIGPRILILCFIFTVGFM